jgi:type II secretory pathway pseudopilin PulG
MRIAAPLFALLVLLSGTIPVAAVASSGAGPAPPGSPAAADTTAPALVGPPVARIDDPTVTELYIAPDPGGDARWTVSVRYDLSSSEDRAAFTDYGREFEAGEAEVGLDPDFFRTLAGEASRATGREMTIRNVTRNARLQNGTGVLSLSFTWTNFVTDTDAGFVIQDAVLMPGNRTWLSSIGPSQRLVVETPPGYQVTDTRFGLTNGSVVVEGPHTFRDPLTISYQQTATTTERPEPPSTPWSLIAGALLAGLALIAAVGYLRWRDGDRQPSASETSADAADEPPGGGLTDSGAAADEGPEAATSGAAAEADDTDSAAPTEGEEDVDPALLSDEERVEHLLDQNGGRMKQARIVTETGWSDAKVSQLLSTMADEGRIKKLRLGRENLISLPDEEP